MSSDPSTEVITIKRAITAAAAAAILITGCSAAASQPVATVGENVSCTISTPSGAYECTAKCISDNMTNVTVNSPENAAGLTFRQSEDGIVISSGSLICKSSSITLSDNSVYSIVSGVIDDIRAGESLSASASGEGYIFTGSTPAANYTAHADNTGKVTAVEMVVVS